MNKCAIITEYIALQNVEYWKLIPYYDCVAYGMVYMVPESESFVYFIHVDKQHLSAATESYAFKYFCDNFGGTHVFINNNYSIQDIDKCIAAHNITKYIIINLPKLNFKNSMSDNHLHSVIIPFVINRYSTIAIVGIPTEDQTMFHTLNLFQPKYNKLVSIEDLQCWAEWATIAKNMNVDLLTVPVGIDPRMPIKSCGINDLIINSK